MLLNQCQILNYLKTYCLKININIKIYIFLIIIINFIQNMYLIKEKL